MPARRETVRIAALGDVHYGTGSPANGNFHGEACEIHGIGFAGIKGFGGGFGERAVQAWGEESIKRFVHEAGEEALKLDAALARLHTPQRVVLMHYSSVPSTVEGEPREIYPCLGSSRLEKPLTTTR